MKVAILIALFLANMYWFRENSGRSWQPQGTSCGTCGGEGGGSTGGGGGGGGGNSGGGGGGGW